VASEALGEGASAWEKRAALAKLVAAPVSWDPTDVPLPRNAGLASRKRAFVLTFLGEPGPLPRPTATPTPALTRYAWAEPALL
jgi:hypothetical protein